MKYLLGIDFGGGASKATLINERGELCAEHTVEYPTLHPLPEACEQRSEDWIRALCENCRAILQKSDVDPREILAVAIDAATHTFLCCGKDLRPIRPAIFWTDARSSRESAMLRETVGERIFDLTFHRPDTIWTLPQLMWLKEHEPETLSKCRYLFFEKDYIRWFLTGGFATDRIDAQGSMLFDCVRQEWSDELLSLCGLSKNVLPPVKEPLDLAGTVTREAAEVTGLAEGTPVVMGTTDTVMEIFASSAVEKGDMTVKIATAGRICVITDQPFPDRHLVNYSHIVKGLWYPGSATKAAASSFRWYRDTFGGSYGDLDMEAEKIAPGSDGLLFHPYLNGELTPLASPLACGSFVGIRSTHTKAHFSRAVLEGVAFSLLDAKQYLDDLGVPYRKDKKAVLIGGGAKSPLWSQITADVLGMDLQTTISSDSSLGSAMLAGVYAGVFADPKEAARLCVKPRLVVEHREEMTEKYREIFAFYKEVQRVLVPLYENRK